MVALSLVRQIQCHAFMNMIVDIAPEPTMLMFTDESAKDEWTQNCHHGWSRKNTQCMTHVYFVCGQCYSILPLLTLDGIITYDIVEGSMTAEWFLEFLRDMVVSDDIFMGNICIYSTKI